MCFFRIRNISRRKQASGKKHVEHCLRHLNKTACEIWSVFDKVLFCVKYLPPFSTEPFNYPVKLRGISSDTAKIRLYSARLSRIIVLLFNKLITKLVTFLNLSVDIFSLHFFFPRTKLRISPDICYLRMTDIESIMTIFG